MAVSHCRCLIKFICLKMNMTHDLRGYKELLISFATGQFIVQEGALLTGVKTSHYCIARESDHRF